jgi:peptidoglycan/xylan/chitin deacetylase (PgdA/CDA1 family)
MFGWVLGGAAAVVYAGYASMAPRSQLYGRTFVCATPGSRQIALTFDDGPNDPYTLQLLEVLARHQVRATFFMIGRFAAQRPEIAREVAAAGHAIGNHTFSHPNLIFCSPARVREELNHCRKALEDAVGKHSNLFRPPYGGRLPHVLRAARGLGMQPVMWSVSSRDWRLTSAEAIERQVMRNMRGGDVVLMHDGAPQTMGVDRKDSVSAADRIIRRYKGEGFAFLPVASLQSSVASRQPPARSVS